MRILEDVDVGGVGDQIWIEPVHYGMASDIAARLDEVFDLKGGGAAAGAKGGTPGAAGGGTLGSDLHVAKVLPDDRSNSLVIIATERAYLRILEFIKRLDVPMRTGEGEIHVLLLQHADATELAKTLNEIVTGAAAATGRGGAPARKAAAKPGGTPLAIFESGVKVSADKATNSIVVTSSLRDFANLRVVIDKLDQPRRQVFIEAVIMDLTIDRENQLGVAFHLGDTANGPNTSTTSGQTLFYGGLNPFRSILLPSPTDSTPPAPSPFGHAAARRLLGSENLLGTGFSIPAFGILLNALASTNDADILSTPHILATDNIPAEINVGQNIPLQTNAAASAAIPGVGRRGSDRRVGLLGAPRRARRLRRLRAPPLLATGHRHQGEDRPAPQRFRRGPPRGHRRDQRRDGPAAARHARRRPLLQAHGQTQLVVKDQQSVVIGGLVRNRVARTDTKIPLLGDIPVLGALFRSRSTSLQKSNLILILTPYIIREQSDLRTVFERKMQERQEFLDHYFVFSDSSEYEPPKDYSRTTGLLEDIRASFAEAEDERRLDELTRPRELKTHEAGQPGKGRCPSTRGRARRPPRRRC